jgi:hypothetical protein
MDSRSFPDASHVRVVAARAQPQFEEVAGGFGLSDDAIPDFGFRRIVLGNLVVVVRELDRHAASVGELFVQDSAF